MQRVSPPGFSLYFYRNSVSFPLTSAFSYGDLSLSPSLSLIILIPSFLDIIQSINASVYKKTTQPHLHTDSMCLCVSERSVWWCVSLCVKREYEWVCVSVCVWVRNVNAWRYDCMFMCLSVVYILKLQTHWGNEELERGSTERSNSRERIDRWAGVGGGGRGRGLR